MVDQYVVLCDGVWSRLETVWLAVFDDKRLRKSQWREAGKEEQRKVHDGEIGDAESDCRQANQKRVSEFMKVSLRCTSRQRRVKSRRKAVNEPVLTTGCDNNRRRRQAVSHAASPRKDGAEVDK